MVTIKLVGYLKKIKGYHVKQYDLSYPVELSTLVSFPELPEDRIIVIINENGARISSIVSGDDEIKILPVIGGGHS